LNPRLEKFDCVSYGENVQIHVQDKTGDVTAANA